MREAFVIIDDVKVFRSYHSSWIDIDNTDTKYCAICEKEIKKGEEVSLLMSNHKLFPNVWVHDCHIDLYGDSVDAYVTDLARYNVVQTIVNKYVQFEKCWKTRKIWGDM